MKIPDKRRLARKETAVCNRDRAFVLDLFQPSPAIQQIRMTFIRIEVTDS